MKNSSIVFALFGYDYFAKVIHQSLGYEIGRLTIHQFPDKETVVRIDSPIKGAQILFAVSLDRPNIKLAPLLFAAETARELGATKIGLIAPYLAYMRQDKQFHSGEGISSKYFANIISNYFDWMITIDPHLHRWHSLSDLYSIPTTVLHASEIISHWIKQHVSAPVLIGPDMESSQWVSEIAKMTGAPFLILKKERKGDNLVQVSIPEIDLYRDLTPILVDDIISTAATMIETVKHLTLLKLKSPICMGVHAIFADNAYEDLLKAGASEIITCNTIQHSSNGIDVSDLILKSLKSLSIDPHNDLSTL